MIDVNIPKMGMSTVDVDIIAVLVAVGDHVDEGDLLLEVEGEKSSFEIPAPVAGTVRDICVAIGNVAEVGDVVVRLEPDAV